MYFTVTIKRTICADLDRAFKAPMLCDVTLVHTGFGIMPRIIGVSDDEDWGKPGGSKRIYAAQSNTQKGGFVSVDHVLERIEHIRWKIRVDQFQSWMLGFYQFEGCWETNETSPGFVEIRYSYDLFAKGVILYPFQWAFAKLFWKQYMKKVFSNVEELIINKTPYLYA